MRYNLSNTGGGALFNPSDVTAGALLPVGVPNDSFLGGALVHTHWKKATMRDLAVQHNKRYQDILVGDDFSVGDILPQWACLASISVQIRGEPELVLGMQWEKGLAPVSVWVDTETVSNVGVPVRTAGGSANLAALANNTLYVATFNPFIVTSRTLTGDRLYFRIVTLPTTPNPDALTGGLEIYTRISYLDRMQANKSGIAPCDVPKVPNGP